MRLSVIRPQHALAWNIFGLVFRSLNRQTELQRLIQWATRKRLPNPLSLYRQRLSDEQVRYAQYCFVSSRAAKLAYYMHTLTIPLRQPPHYPKHGSAAFYRAKRLDKFKNGHIV